MISRQRTYTPRKRRQSTSATLSATVQLSDHTSSQGNAAFSGHGSDSSNSELSGQLRQAVKYGHSFRQIAAHMPVQTALRQSYQPTHSPALGFGFSPDTAPMAGKRKKRRRSENGGFTTQVIVQRESGSHGTAVATPAERAIERSRGKGETLPDDVQSQMGNAFSTDFSGVRVHTNSEANQLNESLSSRAFTTGNDIYFRQGDYQPHSNGGQELLAHELTHVMQQSGGGQIKRKSTLQRKGKATAIPMMKVSPLPSTSSEDGLTVGPAGDRYEQEADSVASEVVKQIHSPDHPKNRATPPTVSDTRHGAIATKHRPASTQGKNNIVTMRRKPNAGNPLSSQSPKHVRSLQRQANASIIQRDGGVKKIAKNQGEGMFKTTVGGVYAALETVENMANLWKMEKEAAEKEYGNIWLKRLQYLVELADGAATLSTSVAFVYGIASVVTAFTPAAPAAALLGTISTIAGQVATVSHMVAFGLKGIQAIAQTLRMKRYPKGSAQYASAQAQRWKMAGGMVSNALGAVFGGLTGGLNFGPAAANGPINIVAGSTDAVKGTAPGAINAAMGEGVNRVADTASYGGEEYGGSQAENNRAKNRPRRNAMGPTELGASLAQAGLGGQAPDQASSSSPSNGPRHSRSNAMGQDELGAIANQLNAPKHSRSNAMGQDELGPMAASLRQESQVQASQPQGLPPEANAPLKQIQSLAQQQTVKSGESDGLLQSTNTDLAAAQTKTTELLGQTSELSGQSQTLDNQSNQAQADTEQQLTQGDTNKVTPEQLKQADAELKKAEAKEGITPEPLEEVNEPVASPEQEQSAQSVTHDSRPRAASAPAMLHRKPIQRTNKSGVVQRDGLGKKIKGFFGQVFARLGNLKRRIAKLFKKVRNKITQLTLKLLGFDKPLQEEHAKIQEAIPQVSVASQEHQNAKGSAEGVLAQIANVKG